MWRHMSRALTRVSKWCFPPPQSQCSHVILPSLQLIAPSPGFFGHLPPTSPCDEEKYQRHTVMDGMGVQSLLDSSLWFAAPKKRRSRGKKRMRLTNQWRLPLKHNIIRDQRTGEVTLRHKLPFKWEDFIPTFEWVPKESLEDQSDATKKD